jgi:L-ascorbate metabolism protein UlaG (beta-lactamase superfamily)
MKIKYLGQSCLLIEIQLIKILVDPMIKHNGLANNIDIGKLNPDYILLTHGHFDHVSDVLEIAQKSEATIVANYEVAKWFESKGLKVHSMNTGGKFNFDFGTLKMVTAVHSSSMPDGSYGGGANGFVLWTANKCIYIAGDTALTLDMQLIPMTCPPLDLAFLPVGDNYTMGYEDSLIAAEFIKCSKIVGYHFDTFPIIKIDHNKAIEFFKSKNKSLIIPAVEQVITI